MLKGTVKFYDKKRKYGFIKPDDGGPKVHFRLSDRRAIVIRGRRVVLGDEAPKGTKLALPRKGTRLVLDRVRSQKGPHAKGWAHQTPYLIAEGSLKKLPLKRVVKVVSIPGQSEQLTEVLWRGKSTEGLEEKFPQLDKGPVPGELFGASIETEYRLEEMKDGHWPTEEITTDAPDLVAA